MDFPPTIPMKPESGRRLGLIAGAGRFPLVFAEEAQRMGHSVVCVGALDMAPPELADYCDTFVTAPLGRLAKAIRIFKRANVEQIVMAGKIHKVTLFHPWRWIKHVPDRRAIHMLWKYARRDKRDDTLLLAVIREFERDGFQFASALDFCPELLVKHGFLTRKKPTGKQWEDIRFGWEMAKEMGRLDIGQTVVVCDKAVLAVEAIEGTDLAIRRAGELCRKGGFTAVKVAKPEQDMRFDVPTIGPTTIEEMHEAGGRVLAIESEMTILLDEPEVLRLANKCGIAIVSVSAEEMEMPLRVAS